MRIAVVAPEVFPVPPIRGGAVEMEGGLRRGRLLLKPRLRGLKERPRAFNLALGVRWFNFFLERVIANLPLFNSFDQMLMEYRVKDFRFREVLAEGGDDGAMFGKRQSLAQQQRLSEVEHRVVGPRNCKSVQGLGSQQFSRFDALAGAFQNIGVLGLHDAVPWLSDRDAFAPNIHQQRSTAVTPVTLSDRNDADDATVLKGELGDQAGEGAEFGPTRGKVIQDQGDVDVGAFDRLVSCMRSEQGQSLEARAILRIESIAQLTDDGLNLLTDHGFCPPSEGKHTSFFSSRQWDPACCHTIRCANDHSSQCESFP